MPLVFFWLQTSRSTFFFFLRKSPKLLSPIAMYYRNYCYCWLQATRMRSGIMLHFNAIIYLKLLQWLLLHSEKLPFEWAEFPGDPCMLLKCWYAASSYRHIALMICNDVCVHIIFLQFSRSHCFNTYLLLFTLLHSQHSFAICACPCVVPQVLKSAAWH